MSDSIGQLPLGAWQPADADITRPANVTAYAANKAIGDSGNCLFTFSNVLKRSGGTGLILESRLVISKAAIAVPSGIAIRGHVYNTTPSSAPAADQSDFLTLLANANAKLGYIDFTSFAVGATGSDMIEGYGSMVTGTVMPLRAGSATLNLFMLLVATAAWTPTASMVFRPYLMAQLD